MVRLKKTLVLAFLFAGLSAHWAYSQPEAVLKHEADRVAVVKKVAPSVVAIFAKGGQGGGTGVLISEDGFALTNFHVVQGSGPLMQCGLPDGVLYDAVLVGLDQVGDVALIKIYPKKDGHKFPFAELGNSDKVYQGDWSLAMGNPFLLATDFQPTVTYGLISGVDRYQYPAGTGLLEYPSCIQIDTSINPGNSGGPLFNMKGDLIGINGRGSFDKRGRINSGVGYAISINQIKNFMGHLYAGINADHASLGATVETDPDKFGRMRVKQILEECDAARRGLDIDHELLNFGGRPLGSVNQFKNALGVYPRGWRLPLEFRGDKGERKEVLVRLMGSQAREILDPKAKEKPPADPKIDMKKIKPAAPSPLSKYYQPKPGFSNFYFNQQMTDTLMKGVRDQGDFKAVSGTWTMTGAIAFKKARTDSPCIIEISEEKKEPLVKMKVGEFAYDPLQPLKDQDAEALKVPAGSGGFQLAVYLYHQFLTQGEKAFKEFTHGGYEPFYPPPPDGKMVKTLNELRIDTEVLNTRQGPFLAKWFFDKKDKRLLGCEVRVEDNTDPCEIYFSDYKEVEKRQLPHRWQVVYGNGHYGTIVFKSFQLTAAK